MNVQILGIRFANPKETVLEELMRQAKTKGSKRIVCKAVLVERESTKISSDSQSLLIH